MRPRVPPAHARRRALRPESSTSSSCDIAYARLRETAYGAINASAQRSVSRLASILSSRRACAQSAAALRPSHAVRLRHAPVPARATSTQALPGTGELTLASDWLWPT